MTTWLYVGTEPRELPGDGVRPSFSIEVGGTVDFDDNPFPLFFDQAGADIPADPQPQE